MSKPITVTNQNVDEVPAEIVELATAISQLPHPYADRLSLVLARVVESTKRRRRILGLVQDALSQLRLDMKYLVFDLEATRRERDAYRSLAEGTDEVSGE